MVFDVPPTRVARFCSRPSSASPGGRSDDLALPSRNIGKTEEML